MSLSYLSTLNANHLVYISLYQFDRLLIAALQEKEECLTLQEDYTRNWEK